MRVELDDTRQIGQCLIVVPDAFIYSSAAAICFGKIGSYLDRSGVSGYLARRVLRLAVICFFDENCRFKRLSVLVSARSMAPVTKRCKTAWALGLILRKEPSSFLFRFRNAEWPLSAQRPFRTHHIRNLTEIKEPFAFEKSSSLV